MCLCVCCFCLSLLIFFFFFFNDTATTEIYTLSLHDALPICTGGQTRRRGGVRAPARARLGASTGHTRLDGMKGTARSEEHTSELQSQSNLVCRLLLEKKKKKQSSRTVPTPHREDRQIRRSAH